MSFSLSCVCSYSSLHWRSAAFYAYGYAMSARCPGPPIDPGFALIWVVGGACAIGTAWHAKYRRVAALVLLSAAGLVSCISFLWLSAPDLALTQLLVETVTTIVLLLGLRWLPERQETESFESRLSWPTLRRRSIDLTLAVVAGLGMAMLSYAIMTRPISDTISQFYRAKLSRGAAATL